MPHRDAVAGSVLFRRPPSLRSPALAVLSLALFQPHASVAASSTVTACTRLDFCYCVNSDYRDAIEANVARVRALIASNKAQGKAIGYLSVPLSPAGGGSFAVNAEIAAATASGVTARLGAQSAWILNPGAEGGDRMNG